MPDTLDGLWGGGGLHYAEQNIWVLDLHEKRYKIWWPCHTTRLEDLVMILDRVALIVMSLDWVTLSYH